MDINLRKLARKWNFISPEPRGLDFEIVDGKPLCELNTTSSNVRNKRLSLNVVHRVALLRVLAFLSLPRRGNG
jgi:hypothetical protein